MYTSLKKGHNHIIGAISSALTLAFITAVLTLWLDASGALIAFLAIIGLSSIAYIMDILKVKDTLFNLWVTIPHLIHLALITGFAIYFMFFFPKYYERANAK